MSIDIVDMSGINVGDTFKIDGTSDVIQINSKGNDEYENGYTVASVTIIDNNKERTGLIATANGVVNFVYDNDEPGIFHKLTKQSGGRRRRSSKRRRHRRATKKPKRC